MAMALCLLAWFVPQAKQGAVAGRLDYLQFLLFSLSTVLLAAATLIAACPRALRRVTGLRVALALVSGLLVLGLVEVASLWIPVSPRDNPWYLATGQAIESDPELPFVRPPHLSWSGLSRGDLALLNGDPDPFARRVTFATDFEGFRNGRDLHRADLVFVGDSFTEAGNVLEEETFVQQVAGQLGLVARNLGRAGYSPPVELAVIERHVPPLVPRLLVWQLTESNDLGETVRYRHWLEQGRPRFVPDIRRADDPAASGWRRSSPTHRLFSLLRQPDPWSRGPTAILRDSDGNDLPMRMLHTPTIGLPADLRPGFSDIAAALEQGRDLLRAQRIALLVVLMPMKFRVLAPSVRFEPSAISRLAQAGLSPPDWDVPPAMTLAHHLASTCRSLGIRFLDLTAGLRQQAAAGVAVFPPYDTHLSARGHAVVAKLLADEMADMLRSGK